jgi:hypothetical protein
MKPMTTFNLLVKAIKIPVGSGKEWKIELRCDSLSEAIGRVTEAMIENGEPWQEGDKGEIWLDKPGQRAPVIEFNVPEKR